FSPTKATRYKSYCKRISKKRQQWGLLCNND
ncbi:hypothetical protein, partial [Klebsiella variicola]